VRSVVVCVAFSIPHSSLFLLFIETKAGGRGIYAENTRSFSMQMNWFIYELGALWSGYSMQRRRGIMVVAALFVFSVCPVGSEETGAPLFLTNSVNFFSQESQEMLVESVLSPDKTMMSFSAGYKMDSNNTMLGGQVSLFAPVNEYICIPVFFSYTGTMADSFYTLSMFTGSGLIFHTKYATVGAYVGYYKHTNYIDADESYDWERFEISNDFPVTFAINPILNTEEYPILGLFTNFIQNYTSVSKEDDSDNSWLPYISAFTRIAFKTMQFYEHDIEVLDAYYYHGEYNSVVNNDIFGIRAGKKHFYVDFGYRHYYQPVKIVDTFISIDRLYGYDDTFFLKTTFMFGDQNNGLALYFDKNSFPLPGITAYIHLGEEGEAGCDLVIESNVFSFISNLYGGDVKRGTVTLKLVLRTWEKSEYYEY
jgi:hypothetical protein